MTTRPIDSRYTTTDKPYRPGDVTAPRPTAGRPASDGRPTAVPTVRPMAPRPTTSTHYSTAVAPRPVAAPAAIRPVPHANPRPAVSPSLSPTIASANTRVRANPRRSGSLGAVYSPWYSTWYDPCYTGAWHLSPSRWALHTGFGCHGLDFSLWFPWYAYTYCHWVHYYRSCWWDTWSTPYYWNSCSSWWYPRTVYYPTYIYVPSETIVVERTVEDVPAEPEAGEAAKGEVETTVRVADSKTAEAGSEAATALAKKYVDLGDFYFRDGRFADALEAYARARTYAPDDASLHFVLADAAFAAGDYHFAAFLIAEGLRLDPSLAAAKADKRKFYGDATKFDVQMQVLDDYLADKPYDASAHLVRGYNLAFSDRPAAAIAAFRRVLEIAPDHRAARTFLDALAPTPAAEPIIR
ncbi:MAG: tetratricopeptide repeat protein [Planctomycetota bacterium]